VRSLLEARSDFPILKRVIHGHPLVFLDNAATTQKPQPVLNALLEFLTHSNANIHRGVYQLSEDASDAYEKARQAVAGFVGVKDSRRVVFHPRHNRVHQSRRSILVATTSSGRRSDCSDRDGTPFQPNSLATGCAGATS
jgi:hypothetical protein